MENKKINLEEYEERTSELMKQKIALGDKIRDRKSRLMQCENQIASLRQRQPTAYALQSVQGTVVEDLFDGSLNDVISTAAGMVAAAIGDATTPMYSGGAGGSSSDDKPKKDDDEDWWRFAHRAARYASRNKTSKSATRSPRR